MRPKSFGFAGRCWRLRRIVAAALVAGFASFGLTGEALALATSTTTVVASANPSQVGQSVTITVTVTGASGTPTGQVTITDYGDGAGGDVANLVGGVATFLHTYTVSGSGGLRAFYFGDGTYDTSVQQVTHVVNPTPTTTTLTPSPNPSTPGQSVTFTATVAGAGGTPTGAVTFNFGDGTNSVGTLSGGVATATHSFATFGTYTVTAAYGTDTIFGFSSTTVTQTVTQLTTTTTVVATPNPGTVGQAVSFTATVAGAGATPTGTVAFFFGDGTTTNGTLAGGVATVTHTYTTATFVPVIAGYLGDATYSASGQTIPLTINQAATIITFTSTPNPSAVGQPVTFTATVSNQGVTPTGFVLFNFGDGTTAPGTLSGGTTTAIHTYSGSGAFTAVANFTGDINYAAGGVTLTQNVSSLPSTMVLGAAPNPSNVGQSVSFTATVSGAGTPTGTVTFNFGDGTTAPVTLAGGVATANHSFAAGGTFTVTAGYGGDSSFQASSGTVLQTVTATSTTVLAAAPNPSNVGQSATFTATVTGTGFTPTGTVTFNFGDGTTATTALAGGVATANHAYAAGGTFTATATYNGDAHFQASTGTVLQNVTGTSTTVLAAAPNPAVVGQSAAFTATVSGAGSTPTGTVTFNFADGTTATTALAGGAATANHAYAATGAFTVTATYNGDVHFQTSTATLQENINLATSTVSVASSQNPSQVGQAVTFTATAASSGGTPGGSVTFKDGAVTLATATLAGGAAAFTTSSLTLGNHAITASYSGSTTFAASSSAALIQAVNTAADSLKLQALQKLAAPVVAQGSGQAISGAVDSAITEGFADGGTFVTPGASGIRFNFAADPEGQGAQAGGEQTASLSDPARSAYSRQTSAGDSTRRVDDAFAALTTKAPTKAPPYAEPRDWLGWAEVHGTTLNHWGTGGVGAVAGVPLLYGNQINVLAGVTRRLLPNFLVGVLGGYENFDYRSDALQGRLKGDGWTVGSYLGWMIAQNVRFDAAVSYSGIGYDGLAGTAAGTFAGQRWLVSGGLTGDYKAYGFLIEPSARIYALWEHENAYTDSLGTLQTARDFSTGRASGGVKLAYPFAWTSTAEIAPYLGIYGDYYFNRDNAAVLAAPAVPTQFVLDGWSARATAGIATRFGNGALIAIGGERGGIGGNFALWTYRARASVPFAAQ